MGSNIVNKLRSLVPPVSRYKDILRNKKFYLPAGLILLLLIIAGVFYSKSLQDNKILKNNLSIQNQSPTPIPIIKLSLKDSTNKQLSINFTSSSSAKLTKLLEKASKEEDKAKSYQDYVSFYKEAIRLPGYETDTWKKLSIIQLQSYLTSYPQYKESDFK